MEETWLVGSLGGTLGSYGSYNLVRWAPPQHLRQYFESANEVIVHTGTVESDYDHILYCWNNGLRKEIKRSEEPERYDFISRLLASLRNGAGSSYVADSAVNSALAQRRVTELPERLFPSRNDFTFSLLASQS